MNHDSSYFPAPQTCRFCTQCGAPTVQRIPPGDVRKRAVCDYCKAIHYYNPRVVVGSVPVWENKILLCRRAIEPRVNTWTLPAGFMELDETSVQGAIRETLEETGANIVIGELFTVIDIPRVNQVHLYYLAQALGPDLAPGIESLEACYYEETHIPWSELSFMSVTSTLKHFLEDRKKGQFKPHYYALAEHH